MITNSDVPSIMSSQTDSLASSQTQSSGNVGMSFVAAILPDFLTMSFKKEVCGVYFGDLTKNQENWTCCSCSSIYKCKVSKGVDNLYKHVTSIHKDFLIRLGEARFKGRAVFTGISPKANNIYGHVENVIENNLPFSSVS